MATETTTSTRAELDALRELGDAKLADVLGQTLTQIEWGEDEITQAQERHGETDDGPLHDAFMLLRGTDELMATEFVYRAHARELLERVANGQDTRPATDVEIACALSRTSLACPIPGHATALYARLFRRAFPEKAMGAFGPFTDDVDVQAYERLYGEQADQLDRELRHKSRQDWRRQKKEVK